MIAQVFPLQAPFRIDQVTEAPVLMGTLFLTQVVMALWIHLSGVKSRPRQWIVAVIVLLTLVFVFFTLGSWGNSDTTRFSHFMQWEPDRGPPEPLWVLARPLVLLLPYRMAAVHGLVATGYATAAILLAAYWRVPAWAGWWSLLICCSPMLRGFMQNAHTRQALAVLLLLPVLLWAAGQIPANRKWLGLGVILSALTHSTFIWNLLISLSPLAVRLTGVNHSGLRNWRGRWSAQTWKRWPTLLLVIAVLVLIVLVAPKALERFQDYSGDAYFSDSPVRRIVGRLQRALGLGLIISCVQKRLDPRQLIRCDLTRLLMLLGVLYLFIQASITHLWLPQITFRLADGVAFFLLIVYLAWLHHYEAHWCVIPALYVTFQYWFEGRILPSGNFSCGLNDEFLCIPDRWPWQVHY